MNPSPPPDLKDKTRAYGVASGFDAIGFARAEPVDPRTTLQYQTWLRQQHHASMDYMANKVDLRLNPLQILPSAKTVIVVLVNYFQTVQPEKSLRSFKIARYAHGQDYHRLLRKRLRAMEAFLKNEAPETEVWSEVDTGPVLERYWAEKAGLGWIGKNTLLINKQFGSWTFIGILLTSLEIPPDPPSSFHCGTCTRCLEVCPTQALLEPGILDSRRCLSYWTIEHRGAFHDQTPPDFNGWIFGCDDCQEVCPWNRHAKPAENLTSTHPLLGYPGGTHSIASGIPLSHQEWDDQTKGTALRRCGYDGYLRNIHWQR
jgi:epoxyqueuosine reductase